MKLSIEKESGPEEEKSEDKKDENKKFLLDNVKNDEARKEEHREALQLAQYSDLSVIEKLDMMTLAGKDEDGRIIIFIFGSAIPQEKKLKAKAYLFFLKFLDENVNDKEFKILYFANGVGSLEKVQINFMKRMFKHLPLSYLINLESICLFQTSLVVKLDIKLGLTFLHKFFRKKLIYLESIKSLEKLKWWRSSFYNLLPDFFFTSVGKTKVELIKAGKDEIPLEDIIQGKGRPQKEGSEEFLKKKLEDLRLSENGIPYVIEVLISYFEQTEDFLNQEGLFRTVGSFSEEQKLINALKIKNYDYLLSIQDTKTVTSVFKKIFSELAVPLFTFESYDKIKDLKFVPEAEHIRYIKNVLLLLPPLHYKVLAQVIKFFRKIEQNSAKNKMTAYNIGVVFAPTILRPKEVTPEDLLNVSSSITTIKALIEHYEEFFEKSYLSDSSITKEISKRKSMIIDDWQKFEEHAEKSKCRGLSDMMASKDDPDDDIPVFPDIDRLSKHILDKEDLDVHKFMGITKPTDTPLFDNDIKVDFLKFLKNESGEEREKYQDNRLSDPGVILFKNESSNLDEEEISENNNWKTPEKKN